MNRTTLSLPLLSATPPAPDWQGFRPAGPIPGWDEADAAPEPMSPQGEYATIKTGSKTTDDSTQTANRSSLPKVELLSPAGGPDAAFAALHHGADAIYLGLKHFSARAEAENVTLAVVCEVTAYARSFTPPRKVVVTDNTLSRQDELTG